MQALFAPAVVLLNRLGYPRKFAVMGVLALVAIAVLLGNLYHSLNRVIHSSRQELTGVELLKPITRVVQRLQVHRGLSSGVLNGNEEMKAPRAAKEQEVSDALAAVAASLPPELAADEVWKRLTNVWTEIQKEGMELIARENFLAHNRMVDDLLLFETIVADHYSLTNDPGIDSSHLLDTALDKSPLAIERMGQLRALGAGVLAKKQPLALSQQVEFTVLLTGLNSAVEGLRRNLQKTSRYNPALQATLQSAVQDMGTSAEKVGILVNQDILSGTYATSPEEYFALTTQSLDKGYKEMYETLYPTLESLLRQRIEEAQRALYFSIAISVVALLVYAYVAIGLYYATIRSIDRLTENAGTIATGDLSVRVDLGTHDELKVVGDSLNGMLGEFRRLIQDVHNGAGEVLAATRKLSVSAGAVTQGSRQQSDAASSMAAAVEELTAGIGRLSSNADEANQIACRAGDLSDAGSQVVRRVVLEIEQIAKVVNRSAAIIADLGQRSEQISVIVNVIKEIADQTNLLALNAAIEAARAGESGRGFAVVADEVRKLAERTTRSTQEISSMIGAIQGGTRDAVASMREGVKRVGEGVVLATEAGHSIDEIGGNARQVVDTVSAISRGLREQSAASSEIARNVERVTCMADENCAIVADNAVTVSQLENLATRLETEVRRFRLV